MVEASLAQRVPNLNGARVKSGASIYLIDDGMARHIPDPQTYNRLFRAWDQYADLNLSSFRVGPSISSRAFLMRADGRPEVYFVEYGTKRWISTPQVMERYYFNWDAVRVVPMSELRKYQTGAPLR